MQTLSYGFLKPQTGDKGSVFFPALEANVQQLNDHTHNGTNSAKLTASSVTVVADTAAAIDWAAVSGQPGTFSQVVAMPAGMAFDDYNIAFRNAADGAHLYLSYIKASATTFTVFINDSSIDLDILYGA